MYNGLENWGCWEKEKEERTWMDIKDWARARHSVHMSWSYSLGMRRCVGNVVNISLS